MMKKLISKTHPEWHPLVNDALLQVDSKYLSLIQNNDDWLPGLDRLFAAFSLPLSKTRYILLAESPYPREISANGYAFWDNAVGTLWSTTGLSKEVNRATSLRNFIKMLLHARGELKDDFSQSAIAAVDKSSKINTCTELFEGMVARGFLLLNASLVYSDGQVNYHARHWQPFMSFLFKRLFKQKPAMQTVLFGRIAKQVPEAMLFPHLKAEHPFNTSFIINSDVLAFFKPMDLLSKYDT